MTRVLLTFAALSLLVPSAGRAGTIFSDNFDTNPGVLFDIASGAVDSSATGTFYVTSGNVNVVGPIAGPELCDTPPETGTCIDLDGNTAGQITSTPISLAPGKYTLAFDLFGNERVGGGGASTVTFGSFYNKTFNTSPFDQNVVIVDFTVASPTSARIVFTSNDAPGSTGGALVDNVVVTSSTPEPGPAILLIGSLSLIYFARRKCGIVD
ncbi:MAG TPA: hypothetical protein VH351_05240 [Bryobacteraceae bacterium]|jgi:hypothetical protein|nr:hypothetical protein [Bryobacteraceae bacterium]